MKDFEIIFVIEGTLYLAVGEQEYEVNPGELILLPGQIRHYGTRETDRKVSFFWAHFLPSDPQAFSPKDIHFMVQNNSAFILLFRQLLHAANTPHYHKTAVSCYLVMIIMELETQQRAAKSEKDPVFNEVCAWVCNHLDQAVTVKALAGKFGYNEDYMSRIFKKNLGMTLKQYLSMIRMNKAKALLLTTNQTIHQISCEIGIDDYRTFLKFFKRVETMTPTQFKTIYCNSHINMQ